MWCSLTPAPSLGFRDAVSVPDSPCSTPVWPAALARPLTQAQPVEVPMVVVPSPKRSQAGPSSGALMDLMPWQEAHRPARTRRAERRRGLMDRCWERCSQGAITEPLVMVTAGVVLMLLIQNATSDCISR